MNTLCHLPSRAKEVSRQIRGARPASSPPTGASGEGAGRPPAGRGRSPEHTARLFRGGLVAAWIMTPGLLQAADGSGIKEMRIEPASTPVAVIGNARLSVEPLTRGEGGLHAPYKVAVQRLPTGGEEGKFTITLSKEDFDKLADGKAFNFGGQALSNDGNKSSVRGTATPSSGDAGAVKIKVEGKRGRLVFRTTYHLVR